MRDSRFSARAGAILLAAGGALAVVGAGASLIPTPTVVVENDEVIDVADIGLRGYRPPKRRRTAADVAKQPAVEHRGARDNLPSPKRSFRSAVENARRRAADGGGGTRRAGGEIRKHESPTPTWTPAAALVNPSASSTSSGGQRLRDVTADTLAHAERQRKLKRFRERVLGAEVVSDGNLQLESSPVEPPTTFKYHSKRRSLAPYAPQTCTQHSDCSANHYCMSCAKCKSNTGSSTCNGDCSQDSTVGVCKPAFHCAIHNDYIGGACPSTIQGCTKTADCNQYNGMQTAWRGEEEYCSDCAKCQAYKTTHPTHECGPCSLGLGKTGFCRALSDCSQAQDATSGAACPQARGCASHSDCGASEYCRDCAKCLERNDESYCSQHICPSTGGGYCYANLAACQSFNDGIGGSCVKDNGCKTHAACGEGYYCMDCAKCQAYHDSLPTERRDSWHCDPCPTNSGGTCEAARWCGIANDGVAACPSYTGCSARSECAPNEFCLAHDSCVSELSLEDCGTKPEKGGFCLDHSYCTASRTTDDNCAIECSGNDDCSSGDFCADYADCVKLRGRRYCGPQPARKTGVCLPQEHCARGLHRPVDGSCPDSKKYSFHSPTALVALTDTNTMNFAIHHQAFNVWHDVENDDPEEEYLVAQVHDDFSYAKRRDDKEYLYMWKVKKDQTAEKVTSWQTSCGALELVVPFFGPYVYEGRISLDLYASNAGIAECSCIKSGYPWSSPGVCPRTVSTQIGDASAKYIPLDNIQQVSFVSIEDLLISNLNQTLYTVQREVSGTAFKLPADGCPSVATAAADNAFHPSQAGFLGAVELGKYTSENVPKIAGASGKFCVVKASTTCSLSAVYRYCLYSGGIGLMRYQDDEAQAVVDDLHLAISLYADERTRTDLIPAVVVTHLAADELAALTAGTLKLKMGPNVGGSALAEHSSSSSGGVRVIEAKTGTEIKHHRVFGAVTYMEPSEIRPILFVCTDPYTDPNANHAGNVEPNYENKRQVRVFSTTEMNVRMNEFKPIKDSRRPPCHDSIYRDYHVVDFKRGDRYYTSFINHHHGNKIEVYDTTDLSDWKIMKELAADWEDSDSGLGAMTVNGDGSVHLLTWHCAMFVCEGSLGSELYLLDSAHPPNLLQSMQTNKMGSGLASSAMHRESEMQNWVQFMSIHSVLRLPIQNGAEGRDIACSKTNVCLVTLNTDGFVVYDVGSYDISTGLHSSPRKIAEHAATFRQSDLPTAYKRSAGAQKVFASRIRHDRFYIEHAVIEMGVAVGSSGVLGDVTRNNKISMVQSDPPYVAGDSDGDRFFDAASADPIVLLTVEVKRSYGDVTKLLGVPDGMSSLEHLQMTIQHGLASALRIPKGHKRFPVTSVYQLLDSIEVNLEILPDKLAPSPLTMLSMLLQQQQTPGSLLHRGVLSPLIDDIFFTGAYSVMGGEGRSAAGESGIVTQFESDYRQIDTSGAGGSVARGAPSAYTVDADTGQVLALSVAFGLVLVIAVTLMVLLLLEQRKRREAEKQVDILSRNEPPATGGARASTLTVVGRPTNDAGDASAVIAGSVRSEATAGMPVPRREAFTENARSPPKLPVSSSAAGTDGSMIGLGAAALAPPAFSGSSVEPMVVAQEELVDVTSTTLGGTSTTAAASITNVPMGLPVAGAAPVALPTIAQMDAAQAQQTPTNAGTAAGAPL